MKLLKTLWKKVKKRLVREKFIWYTKKCYWKSDLFSFNFCVFFLLSLSFFSFNWHITSFETFPYSTHYWSIQKLIIIGPFYENGGSDALFGELFAELAKTFPTEKVQSLKILMQCKYSLKYIVDKRVKTKTMFEYFFFIFFL